MGPSAADLAPYQMAFGRPAEEVMIDLEGFVALVTKWNRAQNLVSRETLATLWSRHVLDSLRVLPLLQPGDLSLADIGSGGGFPALPLAIALKGTGRHTLLVESNTKKCSFLRAAIREFALDAEVETNRAEAVDSRETIDVITARAVASLVDLLGLCCPLFGPKTRGVFHKGREYAVELGEASAKWQFDVIEHTGGSDPEGVLLEISNLQRRQ